jgi:hypothetical protein
MVLPFDLVAPSRNNMASLRTSSAVTQSVHKSSKIIVLLLNLMQSLTRVSRYRLLLWREFLSVSFGRNERIRLLLQKQKIVIDTITNRDSTTKKVTRNVARRKFLDSGNKMNLYFRQHTCSPFCFLHNESSSSSVALQSLQGLGRLTSEVS